MSRDSITTVDGSNTSLFKRVTATFRTPSGGVEKILLDVKVGNTSGEPIPVTLTAIALTATPTIFNVSVILANTEYSQALPDGTRQIFVRCRDASTTRVAFVLGETATKYITIPPGATFTQFDLNTNGLTIYLRCSKPAQTVELLTWG